MKAEYYDLLISRLYEGASWNDPDHQWLPVLREMFSADLVGFLVAPPRAAARQAFSDCIPDDQREIYITHTQFHDKVLSEVQKINLNTPVVADNIISDNNKYDRNNIYVQYGIDHALTIGFCLSAFRIDFFVSRKLGAPFRQDEAALMARLAPHLMTASRIHETVDLKSSQANLIRSAMENIFFGLALVSEAGNVLYANAVMNELLKKRSVLRFDDAGRGTITANDDFENRDLKHAIHMATRDSGSSRTILQLGGGSLSENLLLAVNPLPKGVGWPGSWSNAAAIFLVDPKWRITPPAGLIGDLLELPPRQAEVVALLASGLPTRAIADTLGIQTSSARAYIKAALAKTGTHSQAELLSVLLRMLVGIR